MPTDPYRLGISITAADGRVLRWGGDELNSKDVPTGLSFSTSIPGGFKDWTCSLARRIDIDYPDESLFDDVRVYGPGNETAWEGRMVQFPRQHGDEFSVNPGAVGWAAHLRDDPSFREIYVDRDMGRWGAMGRLRQLDLTGVNYFDQGGSTQVQSDPATGLPAVTQSFSRLVTTAVTGPFAVQEGWYDSGGIPLGIIYTDGISGFNIGAGWITSVYLADNDRLTGGSDVAAIGGVGAPSYLSATTATRTYAVLQLAYTNTVTADSSWVWNWRNVSVYGAHGVPGRGFINPVGFYASEVITDIISRAAPLLTYTTGINGSISPTSFVIPHLVFIDPVTAEDAVSLINGYHLFEWGVYDNRQFFWRPPDPSRLTWEARLSDGAQVSLEGDDANNIFNGVFVTYTDPSGRSSTVGPPGSTADATDASLVDTSAANPVNAHGIPRRWGLLNITNTTTREGAIQLGAVWLAENNLPARRGQLTLTGLVQHPTQGKRPVWAVRAGDYIRIADRPDDPARRIIETSYDHDARRLTASLDQTVFKLEALMERMGVNLVGVI